MSKQGYMRRKKGQTFRPGERHVFKPRRSSLQVKFTGLSVRPSMDTEPVFDRSHEEEIQRAENIAAGLPPDTPEEVLVEQEAGQTGSAQDAGARQTEAVTEPEESKGVASHPVVEKVKAAAKKVLRKVKKSYR